MKRYAGLAISMVASGGGMGRAGRAVRHPSAEVRHARRRHVLGLHHAGCGAITASSSRMAATSSSSTAAAARRSATSRTSQGAHEVAVADRLGKGFATSGNSNSVVVFDAQTLKATGTIAVGTRPDGIVYDPVSRRVFTFNARQQGRDRHRRRLRHRRRHRPARRQAGIRGRATARGTSSTTSRTRPRSSRSTPRR